MSSVLLLLRKQSCASRVAVRTEGQVGWCLLSGGTDPADALCLGLGRTAVQGSTAGSLRSAGPSCRSQVATRPRGRAIQHPAAQPGPEPGWAQARLTLCTRSERGGSPIPCALPDGAWSAEGPTPRRSRPRLAGLRSPATICRAQVRDPGLQLGPTHWPGSLQTPASTSPGQAPRAAVPAQGVRVLSRRCHAQLLSARSTGRHAAGAGHVGSTLSAGSKL